MAFTLEDDDTATPPATATEPSADIAAHADEIAAAAPEVQEHAIAAAAASVAGAEANAERDAKGVAFDARIHTGTRLKSGEWRKKKSMLGAPRQPKAVAVAAAGTLTPEQEGMARAAGAAAIGMMFGTLTQVFGDEWQPRTKAQAGYDERDLMQTAAGDYCVAKNITDFPPGVTLTVLCLGYVVARFQMPVTKSKVQRFRLWFGVRMRARKLRKEFKRTNTAARVEIVDNVILIDGKPEKG